MHFSNRIRVWMSRPSCLTLHHGPQEQSHEYAVAKKASRSRPWKSRRDHVYLGMEDKAVIGKEPPRGKLSVLTAIEGMALVMFV
jgi:hypothetical protein